MLVARVPLSVPGHRKATICLDLILQLRSSGKSNPRLLFLNVPMLLVLPLRNQSFHPMKLLSPHVESI